MNVVYWRTMYNGENKLKIRRWAILRGAFSLYGAMMPKQDPCRIFHVNRFPIAALMLILLRRYLDDFRERFYQPGGKGFYLAKARFEALRP